MKLYWFSNLVQYFSSWDIHEIWRDTYFDVIEEWRQRYRNGHLEIRKKTQICLIQLDVVFKKTMVKSVIASTESSTATWTCACNTQSALWWDWNPFVRKLIKVGSLGENAKNKIKKFPINDFKTKMISWTSKNRI